MGHLLYVLTTTAPPLTTVSMVTRSVTPTIVHPSTLWTQSPASWSCLDEAAGTFHYQFATHLPVTLTILSQLLAMAFTYVAVMSRCVT